MFAAALLPALLLALDFGRDALGANPIEEVTHRTGKSAIVLLGLTLAVTPLRRLTGWNGVIRLPVDSWNSTHASRRRGASVVRLRHPAQIKKPNRYSRQQ